jgi:hypothetical protein
MYLEQAMDAAQQAHARAAAGRDLVNDLERVLRPHDIQLYRWAPAGPVCPRCRRDDDWIEQVGTGQICCRCEVTD